MEVVKIKVFRDTLPWNLVKVTTVLEESAVFIFRIVKKWTHQASLNWQ